MTLKEQVIGVFKAAPYLPHKALVLVSIILMLPTTLGQFIDSLTTAKREATAVFIAVGPIQERIRSNEPEYFFHQNYSYEVGGKSFTIQRDNGYPTMEDAKMFSEWYEQHSDPITVWYNEESPAEVEFENSEIHWSGLLIANIFMLAVAYFMKWMLLKYYELELKEN